MKIVSHISVLAALLLAAAPVLASNAWNGGGSADGNWSNAANWGGAAPNYSSALTFTGTAGLNSTNDSATASVAGFTFNNTAGAFAISGADITLGGNIVNNSASVETLNLNLALNANRTVSVNSGPVVLNGAISGSFSLVKAGANFALTLNSAASSYGTFQINSGPAILGVDNAIPTSASLVFGGTSSLDLNGKSQTLGAITIGGTGGAASVTDSLGGGLLKLGGGVVQNPGGASGAISVPVDLNGANRVFNIQNTAANVTVSGAIQNSSGNAGLVKNGAGTLILSGTNSYNGSTTINAGTLQLNVASLNTSASVLMSNTAVLNLNFAGANVVQAFSINGVAQPPGVYNAASLPGLIIGSGALQVLTPSSLGVWDGGGTDQNWSTGANWDNDVVPVFPIGLTFAGSTGLVNTNDLTGKTVNGITFDAAASAFDISGNAITNAGNIGFNGNPATPVTHTIHLNMDLGGANRTITTQTNGHLVLAGIISGTNTIFKSGAGVLTLSAVNTFTNATVPNVQIRQGTLKLGVDEAIPMSVALNPGANAASTFDLNGKTQTTALFFAGNGGTTASASVIDSAGGGLLKLNGNVSMNTGAVAAASIEVTLDLNGGIRTNTIAEAGQTLTVLGTITNSTGTAGLVKAGAGTLVLAGLYSYNGDTIIYDGTLQLNAASLNAASAVYLTNTAVLNLNFTGTNQVAAIYTNDVALPAGVYNAGNLAGLITGTGALQVSSGGAPQPGNPVAVGVSGGNVTFSVTNTGGAYVIQASTNLAIPDSWVNIYTNTAPFSFTDTNAAQLYPQRFYRTVAQ